MKVAAARALAALAQEEVPEGVCEAYGGVRLAFGPTYQAAGQRDSAAMAYSRFLRFWDKADPKLQGRVREARERLQELTRERPSALQTRVRLWPPRR